MARKEIKGKSAKSNKLNKRGRLAKAHRMIEQVGDPKVQVALEAVLDAALVKPGQAS